MSSPTGESCCSRITMLCKVRHIITVLFMWSSVFLAHRNIYSIAGILHRDIKPGNILICPDGEEGNRGILIDYDHAIRVTDTSLPNEKSCVSNWSVTDSHYSRYIILTGHLHVYVSQRAQWHPTSNVPGWFRVILLCPSLSLKNKDAHQIFWRTFAASTYFLGPSNCFRS